MVTDKGEEMRTMYFNTGVTPHGHTPPITLYKDQVWRGGTKQIPFDVDAPEVCSLIFICDNPDLPESKLDGVIVRKISNSSMSGYAYLRVGVQETG